MADPSKWPISAVETVRTTWKTNVTEQCMGTLVGSKLALTAAHCLYLGAKMAVPSSVHFLIGPDKGVPAAHSRCAFGEGLRTGIVNQEIPQTGLRRGP
jgi:protease YdgD